MPSQQSQSRRLRIHRRISEQDRWLDEIGLFRKHIISDSSCLFRAVSENVYKNQASFHKVRKECVEYMTANETKFSSLVQGSFENYVREMSNAATFGGTIELTVMNHLYRRDFIVFDNNKGPKSFISNGFGKDISLYLIKEKSHYDALFPKEHMETVSFCQSLTYNVLYKGVYEMKDVDFAVRKMLYNESACPHQDYFMAEKLEGNRKLQEEEAGDDTMALEVFKPEPSDGSGDSLAKQKPEDGKRSNLTFTLYPINSQNGIVISLDTNNARELLENKILPFPYKVAKALDPNVYRNIELDTWFEIKREEQTSGLYCDGLSLQVGVKCLCRVGGTSYHCHIQAMAEDSPCLVFVEELGEMRSVPLDQLRPLPPHEARPWYTPYRKDRNRFSTIAHILKQLGYIGTGKNLHHLRYKVKKSSVSQDLVRFNKEHQGYERKSRNYSSDDYFPKELDYKMEDDNNNEVIWTGEDCSDPTTPISSYDEEKYPGLQYLDKYTHLDNIDPYSVEMVAMPLIVEQSAVNGSLGGHVVENGSRDSSRGPPMSGAYVPSPETISNSVHYTIQNSNGGEHLSPMYSLHAHSPIISSGPGGMMWPGYGMLMPPFQPPLQRLPLPLPPPPGVNLAVQRSMNPNGSDLPYHDVQTLRYFFNQGLEWLYSSGALSHALPPLPLPAMGAGSLGPAPPTPTPSPPHHAYPAHPSLHHSRVSPNQLAIDMQQNLTLEDSPNSSVSQEQNKNNNKPNNNQRSKNSEYTPRGGGRGGFNLRYRRNDSNNNNRNTGCNRTQNNYNNRANFNNAKPKNANQENGSQLNQSKVEEQPVQDNVSNSLAADNSFQGNSMAYVSYPPPPLYRIPCYPVAEGEGNVMGVGYTQQYVSYPPGGEEGAPGAEGYPAQYVAYLPPAPPLYYPPTSGYSGYAHYTPATPENHPK